ncbi:restriction endonuclease subunit S [Streptomyces atratus]|uniref:restriction endonuclease subunit S n=1 Tax=Streptomyces atratus TaxID=1893 RepID=UPI0036607B60
MSKLNAWEGALATVDDEFNGAYVSPEYPVFSINEKNAHQAYLRHLLAWPGLWGQLTPRGSMVRRKRTTPATLLATCVPLPELAEQRRVADKLDAAVMRIEQMTRAKEHSRSLALQHADALFRSVDRNAPLAEVLHIDNEFTDVESDSSYPVTGIYSFGRGLIKRPVIQGSETAYPRFARLRTGQVVMSKLNAWEGALAVVGDDFADTFVSPEYPVFSLNKEAADAAYIQHLLAWPELWARLTPRGSMVRRKRTTPATLLATDAPLPSIEEQRRIAKQLTLAREVTDGGAAQVEQLAVLRRTLLDAAFSGRL